MLNDFSAGYTLLILGILEMLAISAIYGMYLINTFSYFMFFCAIPVLALNLFVFEITQCFTYLVYNCHELLLGFRNFAIDIEMMLGKKPSMFWIVMWTGLTPAVVLVSFECVT